MAQHKNTKTSLSENTVLDALESAVLTLDARQQLRFMNPAAENLLRVSQHQARGQSVPALCSIIGEDRFAVLFADALELNGTILRRALPLQLHDGGHAVVDLVVTPLAEGQLIVEMRPMELPARHAEEEMQERIYAAAQEMLRGLAHEIKNPLGGLRGATQLLDRELQRPELKDYTRVILHEVDRLHHLVDRLQGPRTRPIFAEVNIHQVLEHVRRLLQAELPTGISLRFDYDLSIPEIYADQEQLVQVFLNLMRNAQQALDRHGTILIRTRVDRYVTLLHQKFRLALRVDIIDSGPGIPADLLPRIFLPLVTSRAEGMGMGLAIAQGLIRGHGGVVHCHSRPGETVFSVSLPLTQQREAAQ
ncbi:PAS domain-containing sensor histidine kinase [Acidithiobacillus marinus]|uniref:Sensory histidine kinase/phosphatase NtrB n=1 Tax=Acidithiobacillus marinus TaxID=187490 RepID=A0A2I1DLM0_9PROT|nr:nitrogen regulation protein NR(II) [Acidithiobacillus marinus]PKY10775.1 PAS domain-containing sensor histidine kinase [Acidithiobacillus marinus]